MNEKDSFLSMLYQNEDVLIVQTHHKADKAQKFGFNLGLHVFDEPKDVLSNRARLLSKLNTISGGAITELRWANQVHGNTAFFCDEVIYGKLCLPAADALVTSKIGVGLSIMTADCVPIAVFAKDGKAIGCIHAGVKELACGVIKNTLLAMGYDSKDLSAYVGACISQACYELPLSMAVDVINQCYSQDLITAGEGERLVIPKSDKALFDVAGLALAQLRRLGVEIVSDTVPCTYQNHQYYSHRQATHQKRSNTGRMALVIARLR